MSRGERSLLDGLLSRAASLPWWLSALLAVAAFVLFGRAAGVANQALAAAESAAQALAAVDGALPAAALQVLLVVARLGQAVVPLLLLFGAAAAIGQRLKGGEVTEAGPLPVGLPGVDGAQPDASARSGALSWPELETLVSDVYTSQGYSIEKASRGRDGGVDIVLRRGGERFFVQCRHWQPRPLDADAVRDLEEVIAKSRAQRGALVTSGGFTRDALELGRRAGIELIGGPELNRLTRRSAADEQGGNGPADRPNLER